jgi:hypothetical protein
MRHTFRLNVHQKGYTLYSGKNLSQYQEFPLDVQSNGISKNYLSAQKRIDSLLETKISRWHFCVANNNAGKHPVTAYGCWLPIKDEMERLGISFIHAIEGDEEFKIDQVVVSITQLLLQQTIGELSELIAGVAKGTATPEHLMNVLTNHFTKKDNHLSNSNSDSPRNRPIKEIQQNCGGASAATWLAMAISHLGSLPPWEIYEEYSFQTKFVSTVSSCSKATEKHLLSNYLTQIIRDPKSSESSSGVSAENPHVPPVTNSSTNKIHQPIKQSLKGQVALSLFTLLVVFISLFFIVNLKNEVMSLRKQNAEFRNTIESLRTLLITRCNPHSAP